MTTAELNEIASQVATILKSYGDDITSLAEDTTYPFYAIGFNGDGNLRKSNLGNLATADSVDEAKKAVFIDLWKNAVGSYGGYDESTGLFSLNGLTDITYAQAVTIYNQTNQFMGAMRGGKYAHCTFRTNIPNRSIYNSASSVSYTYAFRNNTAVEVIKGNYGTSGVTPTTLIDAFYGCTSLRVIDMVFNCNSITTQTNFSNSVFGRCAALEEVRLRNVRVNVDLSACPNISYESLEYLLNNAANTDRIDIKVHSTVYDKIAGTLAEWQNLRTLGQAKNIYFTE